MVLAAIFAKVDRALVVDSLRDFDPVCGVAMMGVFLVVLALFAGRWWSIATALGIRAPLRQFTRVLWISQCVGEFGPPLVVGELARFRLMRGGGDAWPLAASQVFDRLSGQVVLLAIALGLLPYYLDRYSDAPIQFIAALILILMAAAGVGIWVFYRFWPMARVQGRAVVALCHPLKTPGHFVCSLSIQVLLSLNFALAALGLGQGRDFWSVLLVGPLLLLGVGSLPGLVSDWGKREAAALVLLVPAGLTSEQSLAVSLIYGAFHLLATLPGALLWVGAKPPGKHGAAG